MKIAIIGAGVLGRLFALRLSQCDVNISLFDRDFSGKKGAGKQAAGMIAPVSERVHRNHSISAMGHYGLHQWLRYQKDWPGIKVEQLDTLWVSHYRELEMMYRYLKPITDYGDGITINTIPLKNKIPYSVSGVSGVLFESEACIDPSVFYAFSHAYLQSKISLIQTEQPFTQLENTSYDLILDTRGWHPSSITKSLRAVKGEAITLSSAAKINQMIRFFNKLGDFYLVPRGQGIYYLGATALEYCTEDSISVLSVLQMLSTLVSFFPVFQDAKILKIHSGIRPTYESGLPKIKKVSSNHIIVNGLSRHGYLLAPYLVELTLNRIGLVKEKPSLEDKYDVEIYDEIIS